jgi:hypothetical protein
MCSQGRARQFYEASITLQLLLYPYSPQLLSVGGGSCAAVCYAIPRWEPPLWLAVLLSPSAWPVLLTLMASVRPALLGQMLSGLVQSASARAGQDTPRDPLDLRREAFLQVR